MNVSREVIQAYIYEYSKDKPKGATFKKGKHYFKVKNNRVWYYHHLQKKWFKSVIYNINDLKDFYKC